MSELLPCPCCGSDNSFYTAIELHRAEAAIIRAFVERVEKRLPDYDTGRGAESWLKGYRQAVYVELEAMEKEAEMK